MNIFANLLYIDFIYIFSFILESCTEMTSSLQKEKAITFDLEQLLTCVVLQNSLFSMLFQIRIKKKILGGSILDRTSHLICTYVGNCMCV